MSDSRSTASSTSPEGSTLPAPLRAALQSRLAGSLELPLLPATAAQVLSACEDEETDLSKLDELIQMDQTLAVHVLRVANSAAYASREPLGSLQQAINRLGLVTVGEIVLAVSLKGSVFTVPGHQTRVRALWMHAAATAVYAREVATAIGRDAGAAFLCGLLHDVGMPVTLQALCDLGRAHGAEVVPSRIAEQAMREFHEAVGSRLAHLWGLGARVMNVLRFHHEPARATIHAEDAWITSLADDLAYWALDDSRESIACDELPQLAPLRITEQQVAALRGRRGRVLEVTEAFL